MPYYAVQPLTEEQTLGIGAGMAHFDDWLAMKSASKTTPSKNQRTVLTEQSSRGYKLVWRSWLIFLLERNRMWLDAGATDILQFLATTQPTRRADTQRAVSPATRQRYWRLLLWLYQHAVRTELLTHNPALGLEPGERPPSGRTTTSRMAPGLLDHLYAAVQAPLEEGQGAHPHTTRLARAMTLRDKALICLLASTALTPQEVTTLAPGDLTEFISAKKTDGVMDTPLCDMPGAPPPAGPPGGATRFMLQVRPVTRSYQERTLKLPPATSAALKNWLIEREDLLANGKGATAAALAHVFFTSRYQALNKSALQAITRNVLKGAAQRAHLDSVDLTHLGPMMLRNAVIYSWKDAGLPDSEIVQRAGLKNSKSLLRLMHTTTD